MTVGNRVFGEYCGAMAESNWPPREWRDISRSEFATVGFELVPAGSAVILLGRNVATGADLAVAYRPQ